MTSTTKTIHPQPAQDRVDPATDAARSSLGDAVGVAIEHWADRLKDSEAARAKVMVVRETESALADLRQLRTFGMAFAEQLDRQRRGLLTFAEENAGDRRADTALRFIRIARAIRQIIAMEAEMMGTRPVAGTRAAQHSIAEAPQPRPAAAEIAPAEDLHDCEQPDLSDLSETCDLSEPSDLDDIDDYDTGSFNQVLHGIRKSLGIPLAPDMPRDIAAASAPAAKPRSRKRGKPAWLTASAAPVGAGFKERPPP